MNLSRYSISLNIILLVILGGSLTLNSLLFKAAKKYYLELNQVRLDPIGLNYYKTDSKNSSDDVKDLRIVFFGDSRAAGWISPDSREYEFVNRGISSQTTIQTRQRFSAHVSLLEPDIVVIQVGINDLKTIALFPEDKALIVANAQANIQAVVEASKSLGATVILTTIFPAGEMPLERRPFWSDEIGQAVETVNAYIESLADDEVFVFDAFSRLADEQGMMQQQYRADELHINRQGYAILNSTLLQLIDAINRKAASE